MMCGRLQYNLNLGEIPFRSSWFTSCLDWEFLWISLVIPHKFWSRSPLCSPRSFQVSCTPFSPFIWHFITYSLLSSCFILCSGRGWFCVDEHSVVSSDCVELHFCMITTHKKNFTKLQGFND
jgi:hypothetical protein